MILISNLLCTGFGIGKVPFFPGTLASLSILPLVWFLKQNYGIIYFSIFLFLYFLISLILIKICIKKEKQKDPSYIVIDEHIGQAVALLFCNETILNYLLAFILFRFFDILKPFPISYFDRIDNSFGIIADDIAAGLISGIALVILL